MPTVDKYLSLLTFNGVAGEALTEGQLVGISSAGTVWKADANAAHSASGTNRALGVAVRSVASGGPVAIAPVAQVSGLTGHTAGNIAYLDVDAGDYTTVFADIDDNTVTVQIVGVALTTAAIAVNVGIPLKFQTAGTTTVAFL